MPLERLHRDKDEEIKVGIPYNATQIEDVIMSNRWPQVKCKLCGGMHSAAIRKVVESMEGSQFEFCEPECSNSPAKQQGE